MPSFELPADESALIVSKALEAVERVALSALRELVGEVQTGHGAILGISLVAGSATDPESIHNPHMRAHAREGQLFPHALAAAARAMRIPAVTMVESEVFASAAAKLGKSPDAIKARRDGIGPRRRQAMERRGESARPPPPGLRWPADRNSAEAGLPSGCGPRMSILLWTLSLLVGAVLLAALARRINVPVAVAVRPGRCDRRSPAQQSANRARA